MQLQEFTAGPYLHQVKRRLIFLAYQLRFLVNTFSTVMVPTKNISGTVVKLSLKGVQSKKLVRFLKILRY
jgi:hypothetical protein